MSDIHGYVLRQNSSSLFKSDCTRNKKKGECEAYWPSEAQCSFRLKNKKMISQICLAFDIWPDFRGVVLRKGHVACRDLVDIQPGDTCLLMAVEYVTHHLHNKSLNDKIWSQMRLSCLDWAATNWNPSPFRLLGFFQAVDAHRGAGKKLSRNNV